jgi:hypothetical protein
MNIKRYSMIWNTLKKKGGREAGGRKTVGYIHAIELQIY